MEETKNCIECKNNKTLENFHVNKNGSKNRNNRCKECRNFINRERHKREDVKQKHSERMKNNRKDPEYVRKINEYGKNYYKSDHGRTKSLLKSAKRRSYKFDYHCDIDYYFILEKLEKGYCEATGIVFDKNGEGDYSNHPYSPSLDRVDSKKGYTKENVRMVIWQFNLMKGEVSDEYLLSICDKFIENKENECN